MRNYFPKTGRAGANIRGVRVAGIRTLKISITKMGYQDSSYILVTEDLAHCKEMGLEPLAKLWEALHGTPTSSTTQPRTG